MGTYIRTHTHKGGKKLSNLDDYAAKPKAKLQGGQQMAVLRLRDMKQAKIHGDQGPSHRNQTANGKKKGKNKKKNENKIIIS
jgi:hypothetical protein